MYSIGKLAKLSNVTIRTLRYYDEIGLLEPSTISEGGHRYYDTKELEKLQKKEAQNYFFANNFDKIKQVVVFE